MVTISEHSYIQIYRQPGGGCIVEGQSDHLPADNRLQIGDYTITAKIWNGIRCYISAYIGRQKIFDGCYIELREWSSGNGRMQAYSINFENVTGKFISAELADALVEFLKNW